MLYEYWTESNYVFLDPMEKAVLEVLLILKICHSPRALESDLIDSPFQPHSKGGDLLIVALHNFIKTLHQDVEGGYYAKDDQ